MTTIINNIWPSSVANLHQTMTQGQYLDSQAAQLVTLSNQNGMTITLMDIGATWLSCTVPVANQHREVLLGVDSIEQFIAQRAYLGATVGRFANRIADARFELDGQHYQLNQNNPNYSIHGGAQGFDKRRWHIVSQTETQVVFGLHSADGEQGYPGNLDVQLSYRLSEDNQVVLDYQATVDKACPVNLTNHSYFNLAGAESQQNALQHHLTVHADKVLASDACGLPTEIIDVTGTGFDFRHGKTLAQDWLVDAEQKLVSGYDHAFIFAAESESYSALKTVAKLVAPDEQVAMLVHTTKPAMQVYSGNFLAGCPARQSAEYANYAGIALETQYLPDSPNHPQWHFSDSILRPQQTYQHQTCYQFSITSTISNLEH